MQDKISAASPIMSSSTSPAPSYKNVNPLVKTQQSKKSGQQATYINSEMESFEQGNNSDYINQNRRYSQVQHVQGNDRDDRRQLTDYQARLQIGDHEDDDHVQLSTSLNSDPQDECPECISAWERCARCSEKREEWDTEENEEVFPPRQKWLDEDVNEDIEISNNEENVSEERANKPQQEQQTTSDADPQEGVDEEEEEIEKYKQRLRNKDTTVIFEMFELVLLKLTKIEGNMQRFKRQQNSVSRKVRALDKKVKQSVTECGEIGLATTALVKASIKCEEELDAMQSKVEKIDVRTLKGSLTIHSILEKDKENVYEEVDKFFKQKLGIQQEVEVQSVFRFGKPGGTRPISIKLYSPDDLGLIYANVKKLADQVNENNQPYSIKEFSTEKQMEDKQRARDIKMENNRTPMLHKASVTMKQGKVFIDRKQYVKAVDPPKIKDVLLMTQEKKDELQQYKIAIGPHLDESDSRYYTYSAEVNDLQDVKNVYLRLKRLHLAATHVMCGYRIFGVEAHQLQDYCDDNEHGGGRTILNQLKKAGVLNYAVFVIRYYGGVHLGPRRFEIIRQLTDQCVAEFPNRLEYGNNMQDKELLKSLAKAATRPARPTFNRGGTTTLARGRGGHGRGRRLQGQVLQNRS